MRSPNRPTEMYYQIRFKDAVGLKKGEEFVEVGYGDIVAMVVETEPTVEQNGEHVQVKWEAKEHVSGRDVNYLMTEGLEHYGPKIYRKAKP